MTSADSQPVPHEDHPDFDEDAVPVIEDDQSVAPRPEEEAADLLRSKPAPRSDTGRSA